MSLSKGAQKIYDLLKENNYNFCIEKTFNDLNSYKGKPLRFDFAVYNKNHILLCLIEYDSELHFQPSKFFFDSNRKFKQAQNRDRMKNKYCLINNIELIRIPYWAVETLTIQDIFINKKYKVKDKYHNDNLILEPKNE